MKHVENRAFFGGKVTSVLVESADGTQMTIGEVHPEDLTILAQPKGRKQSRLLMDAWALTT